MPSRAMTTLHLDSINRESSIKRYTKDQEGERGKRCVAVLRNGIKIQRDAFPSKSRALEVNEICGDREADLSEEHDGSRGRQEPVVYL